MRSKIVNFICSCSSKHRMFPEVCNDMEADVMKLYIMLRHDFIHRKSFRAGVSTAAKVAEFPCSKRTPTVH